MTSIRPTQEAIETFTRITGASEIVAIQKLEEYGGNLNEAVNSYFNVGYRHITNPTAGVYPPYNTVDMNNRTPSEPNRLLQFLNAARSFKPSSLLDPNYRRNLLNEIGASAFTSNSPSHTGAVVGVPVQSSSGIMQPHHPATQPSIYDGPGALSSSNFETQGNGSMRDDQHLYSNDVEEEMVQAALEASKQEESPIDLEDDEFARALSLSLKTAEQEKAMREHRGRHRDQHVGAGVLGVVENIHGSNSKSGNSSLQAGNEDVRAQSPSSFISRHGSGSIPQPRNDAATSNEWGGISSKELDEAVMLEAALFGVTSESIPHGAVPEPHTQRYPDRSLGQYSLPVPSPSSSSMTDQLLREQQDHEYLASLISDRERDMNASKEAELLRLKDNESRKELLEKEKFERWLAAKEASLPKEPALDDSNAVALLVKMPDGSRRSRRFLKSHKLQFLFDFIDVSRAVKPGTYKVVRPYPRHTFNVSDGQLSLEQLGLTSKQEALFLEFM